MAVSFSSLGTPPRLGPLAFPAASFCDAGLDQKIFMNKLIRKHEDARSLTRAALQKAVYGCGPRLTRGEAKKMLTGLTARTSRSR